MSIMSLDRALGTISSGRGSPHSILPNGSHSCEDVFGREEMLWAFLGGEFDASTRLRSLSITVNCKIGLRDQVFHSYLA